MLKSVVLASAICLAFVGTASAQDKFVCDEAGLTKMRATIDAMTDKEKQKTSVEAWEAANTAFKANDINTCNERLSESGKTANETQSNTN